MSENSVYWIKYQGQDAMYLQKTALFLIEQQGSVLILDEKEAIDSAEIELNNNGFVKELNFSNEQKEGLLGLVKL